MSDTVLAVIPARGGSKRIPRKNLKEVAGKPLVAHAVEQAEQAETLDEVVVSTDDDEIERVAREYGGTVPFERPAELATDTAPSAAAVEHALSWYEREEGQTFDVVAKIQVTSPLRTAEDIDGAIERLRATSGESVVSISEWRTPPVWAVYEGKDEGEKDREGKDEEEGDGEEEKDGKTLQPFFEGYLWTDERVPRSQDVPDLFYPNGAVFAAKVSAFRRAEGFYTEETVGYEMAPEHSIDIDEPFDLRLARALAESDSQDVESGSRSNTKSGS